MTQELTPTNAALLVGRRLYRIGPASFHYTDSGAQEWDAGPTDFHTIKGVLPDGRVIAEQDGRMVVLVIGEEWHLEESTS